MQIPNTTHFSIEKRFSFVGESRGLSLVLKERPHQLHIMWWFRAHRIIKDLPTDFLHLTASFCADLVPVGVWTDRFEELFPEQNEVVEFLRRWEERKREIDSYGEK